MAKILLVEDNEMNRDMLGRRLARRGFEMLFAADGREALRACRAERPDLVLMDLSLPVMDGWEAIRRIKADPELKRTPVIALTAHAMPQEEASARAAGCDDFETKPIEFARLLEKIRKLLPRPSDA